MIKNKKVIAAIAIILILGAFLIYTMVSEGIFFNKGVKLTAIGSKAYISPGKLLYSYGSTDGAWVVYLKTGQTIISYMDKHGNKQWQNVYAEPKLKVNSSKNYTIVGESDSKEVKILNTEGEEAIKWNAVGNPLLCSINNEGTAAVVADVMSSKSSSWLTNLTVSRLIESSRATTKLREVFTKDFKETEFIEVKWWRDGVVALVYKVSHANKGQYILVLDNNGEEIYSKKVSEAVSNIAVSPNGDLLTWTSDNIVYKYNTKTSNVTELKHKGVISCGFISDTKMYMISNQTGLIPYGRRVHVDETNLAGKSVLKANFPGYLVNDEVLADGTLTVTTNKGVYAIAGSKGVWYTDTDQEIFNSAIDNNSIYTITKDDSLVWYQKP